jgi:RNA polymerase sigma factor (sigma-70 family)
MSLFRAPIILIHGSLSKTLLTTLTKTATDEELIAAIAQGGKTDLFGMIYDRYANKVYRKCISFVKDPDIAQDMVQDVFLKVFFQISRFKGKSRFSTWLYAITYNFCVEYYRKHNKYTMVDIDEGPEIADHSMDEQEVLQIRTEILKRSLEAISPEDKMILLMKYQDDTPIKDIMDHLSISESAVKMRLARARKRVKTVAEELEKAY